MSLAILTLLSGCGEKSSTTAQPAGNTTEPATVVATPTANDGKHVAAACLECHPANGDVIKPSYPQINGQTVSYLSNALHAYISGARKNEEMQRAVANMKEQDITDMANYYAALDTPWKTVLSPATAQNSSPRAEDITAGETLAAACFSCHGKNGNSETDGISSLAGLSAHYFSKALDEYFTDQRDNDFMKVFKTSLTPDKVRQLAAYFSQQHRSKSKLPVKGNSLAGQRIARQKCNGCHGEGGNSALEFFPTIAGQNQTFLKQAITDYVNGHRRNAAMQIAVKGLSAADINNLSAYFAQQTPEPIPDQTQFDADDPGAAASAAAKPCWGCHGKQGNSSIEGTPNLSGMSPNYLHSAILAYQTGSRSNEIMKVFVENLRLEQIDLISYYFASQKPIATKFTGKGKPNETRPLIPACASCHGYLGISTTNVPSIAGQDASYIRQALLSYQNGTRISNEMKNATAKLKDTDINNLASFYARQKPSTPTFKPLLSAQQWTQKCLRCHVSQQPGIPATGPRITGQTEAYIRHTLLEYRNETRKHSTMIAMTDILSDWEISRLARYLANLNSNAK